MSALTVLWKKHMFIHYKSKGDAGKGRQKEKLFNNGIM